MASLHWIDLTILIGFFLSALAIGIYQACIGGHQRTIEEFLLANRKLRVIPTVLSFFASLRSVIGIIGVPAEVYSWGTQWTAMEVFITIPLSMLIIERFMVPWLYQLKLISINEYLQRRFQSKTVRRLAAIISIFTSIIFIGSSVLSASIALEVIADFPAKTSIFLMLGFCVIYTFLGGMRAVVWTDVLQAGIMFGGLLFFLIHGCRYVGGASKVFEIAKREERLFFAEFDPDPTLRSSFWSLLLGLLVINISGYGLSQVSVQRYVSLPTLRDARIMVLLTILAFQGFYCLTTFTALMQIAFFSEIKCDPIESRLISTPNAIFPFFIKMHFREFRGTNGIILATLYSGSLSTISSCLSGIAANTWEDFLKPLLHKRLTESQATMLNRVLVIIYGFISVGATLIMASLPSNVLMLTVTLIGVCMGPIFGMFILGGLTETAEWIGALIGGITGFLLNCVIVCGTMYLQAGIYTPLPPLSTSGCAEWLNNTSIAGKTPSLNQTFSSECNTTESYSDRGPVFHPVKRLKGIQRIFSISTNWYPVIGLLTTMVVGYIVSAIVQRRNGIKKPSVDSRYLISWRNALRLPCWNTHELVKTDTNDLPCVKHGDEDSHSI